MFNKKPEEELSYPRIEPDVTNSPGVRTRKVSVIGPTLHFKGELSANEDLIIEGRIEGTIAHQDKNLTVGKEGRVNADIHAKSIEIFGQVQGDIRGDEIVKIVKSAIVTGNVTCPRVVMEDGAQFSGGVDTGKRKESVSKPANLTVAEPASQAKSVVS